MSNLLSKEISFKGLLKRRNAVAKSLETVDAPEEHDSEAEVSAPVSLPPYKPRTPEINIIPGYLLEEYKTVDIRNKFIAVVAILALAFTALFVYQSISASSNEQSLNSLNSRIAGLSTEVQELKVYEQYQTGVLEKRTSIGTTMNTEIALGRIAETLNTAATSNGVQLTGMSIAVNADPASGTGECVNPDPFSTTSSVGCVTFTGTATDRTSVEGFLQTLEGTPGLVIPYIPNYVSGEGEGGNAISGSVAFTEEFQSQRYIDLLTELASQAPADTEEAPVEGTENAPIEGEEVTP